MRCQALCALVEGESALAQCLLDEALVLAEATGKRGWLLFFIWEAQATLAKAMGDLDRAAQLLGKVDAARAEHDTQRYLWEQRTYETLVEEVREALGDAFIEHYEAGRQSLA